MRPWFNELDGFAARWLRNLYPESTVDERSIRDLGPDDVVGGRCHFFAGIAGWELALDLAGWPEDREVWTGSCPCQPYSAAGKRKGDADDRNLWPDFFRLIRECRPECVFGEQVEGAIRHGWLDGVCADLEGEGYAVGSVVLGAHSVGAPHIRQRLFWVADAGGRQLRDDGREPLGREAGEVRGEVREQRLRADAGAGRDGSVTVADAGQFAPRMHDAGEGTGTGDEPPDRRGKAVGESGRRGEPRGLGDASSHGREQGPAGPPRAESYAGGSGAGFWDAYDLIPCRDGKARRVEPGTFPLAHGVSGRVGLLRGYGNSIVPQVGEAFVRAYLETKGER
jgi:DNA (cytosine-5)-methyltransferase 1